ncbi:hypothetical protein Pmani_007451 [Petrolisthes manimaculis]|uniref:PHD-type domain-containing protein n=1 Tax=Petrolisthes manimaculis TaxID=1843537 RepID=A0AAE1Q8M9_9EUCA|nr:hypothetical protein Pmani_007451 [Petrolisthes manimaculis]
MATAAAGRSTSTPGNNSQGKTHITLCGTCNKQVGDNAKALECEVCNVWFHAKCHNVSDKLYEALTEEDDNCAWYCNNSKQGAKKLRLQVIAVQKDHEAIKFALQNLTEQCATNANEVSKLNNNIRDTNQQVKDLQSSLEIRLGGIEAKLQNLPTQDGSYLATFRAELEQKIDAAQQKTTTAVQALEHRASSGTSTGRPGSGLTFGPDNTRVLRQGLTELDQIEKRKLNLIIANLPEQESPEEDMRAVTEMFKEEFKLVTKITRTSRQEDNWREKTGY